VAGATGYYLAQEGAKIGGIIDRDHGIIDENGLDFETVKELMLSRKGNKLSPNAANVVPSKDINEHIWDVPADIFIPGAASNLVKLDHTKRLINKGLKVMACGANVPFADSDMFFGETAQYVDEHCTLIPDFLANCGMARLFAYLMNDEIEISDEAIFGDVSTTIRDGLFEVYKKNTSKKHFTRTALGIALKKIME